MDIPFITLVHEGRCVGFDQCFLVTTLHYSSKVRIADHEGKRRGLYSPDAHLVIGRTKSGFYKADTRNHEPLLGDMDVGVLGLIHVTHPVDADILLVISIKAFEVSLSGR